MIAAAGNGEDLGDVLASEAPVVMSEIISDQASPDLLDLWGTAINFNQLAGGAFSTDPVVNPAIVDTLNALMGVAPRQDRTTHAGVQHTYGYLFSVLQTPFGYKRARWVSPDVTAGFGLPDDTLGPTPPDGTLFANATFFAGSIAFNGEAELATVQAHASEVAAALQSYDLTALSVQRLTETATLADGREVSLRTDFVSFPTVDPSVADGASASANAFWLVYSVHDSQDGRSRLITAFPISPSSEASYTDPSKLGSNVAITTQYNAWVDGLSGTTAMGSRTLAGVTLGG